MTESDSGHHLLVKLVIVTIAFPILVVALMQPWKLVLLGLAWVLPVDKEWAQWVGWSASIAGVTVAGYAALRICRLIWPKTTARSHA